MKSHEQYKVERMSRDTEFQDAYQALEYEYDLRRGVTEARLRLDLTQRELAERMGTTQSVISRMEMGQFNPRIDTLLKLARVLGVEFIIRADSLHVVQGGRKEGGRGGTGRKLAV